MRQILYIAFTLFALTGCDTIVTKDLGEIEPVVNVEAIIATEDTWIVNLFYSRLINDFSDPKPVTNATITIEGEGNSNPGSVFLLTNNGNGNYTHGSQPAAGKTYNMTIEVDGQVITSQTYLPKSVNRPYIFVSDLVVDTFNREESLSLELSFEENGIHDRYFAYDIEVVQRAEIDTGTPNDEEDEVDDTVTAGGGGNLENNGSKPNGPKFGDDLLSFGTHLSIDDRDDSGTVTVEVEQITKTEKINIETTDSGENIVKSNLQYKVKVWSISYDYYQYLVSISSEAVSSSETYSGDIYGNVTNGTGIFAGYSYNEFIIEK